MRRPSRTGLSLLFAFHASIQLAAQDLSSIGKGSPLTFSGGLSLNQIFYATAGTVRRRAPYSYFASGNINLSLYGWSVPLTFSVSRGQKNFTQPFNQYSLHPTWKWITAHAGYTSMTFSPYTVNGHVFLGGGVDVAGDGKWKCSALYGRFIKAVEGDTVGLSTPTFQRYGYALKVSYGQGANVVDLILFRAEDDAGSIRAPADSLGITPQENLVLSLRGGKTVFRHLVLKAEVAASAITKDTRAGEAMHDHPMAKARLLFHPRLSSSYYQAYKTSLDYQHSGWILGVAYERVDPGYRTLGAYYFNNDLENITVNISGGIREGKLNIAVSAGLQRDNLDNAKASSMRRRVGSANLSFVPSQRLSLSASWSGFRSYANIRPSENMRLTPYDNLDTLNFTQLSGNAALSGIFTLPGGGNKRQTFNINLTHQKAADEQANVQHASGTTFLHINAGYALALIPQNTTLALTFNTSINEGVSSRTTMIGPGAAVSRVSSNRRLRTNLSSTWFRTSVDNESTGAIFNTRLNAIVSVREKHNISVGAVMVTRTTSQTTRENAVTEFTATAGYTYTFNKRRHNQ